MTVSAARTSRPRRSPPCTSAIRSGPGSSAASMATFKPASSLGPYQVRRRAGEALRGVVGECPHLNGDVDLVTQRVPAPVGGPAVEVAGDASPVAPRVDGVDAQAGLVQQPLQPMRGEAPVIVH